GDGDDCIRLAVNLQGAADKIAAATHPFPESIARDYYWKICVRPALLRRVKAATPWLYAHEREVVLGSQKRETTPHVVIAADSGHCKINRAYISKHIFPVLAQLTEFIVGKLAVIVRGILPGRKNIHDLLRMKRHYRLEHHAVNERESGRVNSDGQRQCKQRHRRKPRRFDELSNSKFEILNHRRSTSVVSGEMQCALVLDSRSSGGMRPLIQTVALSGLTICLGPAVGVRTDAQTSSKRRSRTQVNRKSVRWERPDRQRVV